MGRNAMKIEKGIPIQEFKRSLVSDTLKEMEVGDSVLITKEDIVTRQDIPNFNRDKFLARATKAWKDAQPEIDFDDEIPY